MEGIFLFYNTSIQYTNIWLHLEFQLLMGIVVPKWYFVYHDRIHVRAKYLIGSLQHKWRNNLIQDHLNLFYKFYIYVHGMYATYQMAKSLQFRQSMTLLYPK